MSKVAELQALIDEDITKSLLDRIEAILDKLFARINIDIEFTKHFLDRVNDERNIRPVTVEELMRIFKDVYDKHGPDLKQMGDNIEAVLKDIQTSINIPFVLNYNHRSGKIELISKTIMRKKNFMTSNPVIEV